MKGKKGRWSSRAISGNQETAQSHWVSPERPTTQANAPEIPDGPENFPGGSDGKESACSAGDPGSISGLGIFPLEKGMVTHSSLLPGESHGQRSLAGYGAWGRKESEVTERLTLSLTVKTAFLTLGSVWGPGSAGPSPVLLRT